MVGLAALDTTLHEDRRPTPLLFALPLLIATTSILAEPPKTGLPQGRPAVRRLGRCLPDRPRDRDRGRSNPVGEPGVVAENPGRGRPVIDLSKRTVLPGLIDGPHPPGLPGRPLRRDQQVQGHAQPLGLRGGPEREKKRWKPGSRTVRDVGSRAVPGRRPPRRHRRRVPRRPRGSSPAARGSRSPAGTAI